MGRNESSSEYEFGSRYVLLWIAFVMGIVFLTQGEKIHALTDREYEKAKAFYSAGDLTITKVENDGFNDFIEVTNMGEETVNLQDYIFLDNENRRFIGSCMDYNIGPKESVIIYCKNYMGKECKGHPQVNFNLKKGETLSLYNQNKELLQSVEVK